MVPVRAVFAKAPIIGVWAKHPKTWWRFWGGSQWAYWAPHSPVSDLLFLEDGMEVAVWSEREFPLEWNGITRPLIAGRSDFVWRDSVGFVPGQQITASTLAWAKGILKETRLYAVLELAGVRQVVIVPGLPAPGWWGPAGGSWGDVTAARAVVLPDVGAMPGSYLPATILHEAIHAWQISRGLDVGSSSQLLEITASMGAQLFHFLYDGLEAFCPGSPYGSYANLFKA